MTTKEIAERLIELCNQGDYETCYQELYSPEIRSIEPEGSGWEVAFGFEGINKKGKKWREITESFHGSEIGQPIIAGNYFALPWTLTLTFKGDSEATKFEQICLYEIKNRKIVKEQFFYELPEKAFLK